MKSRMFSAQKQQSNGQEKEKRGTELPSIWNLFRSDPNVLSMVSRTVSPEPYLSAATVISTETTATAMPTDTTATTATVISTEKTATSTHYTVEEISLGGSESEQEEEEEEEETVPEKETNSSRKRKRAETPQTAEVSRVALSSVNAESEQPAVAKKWYRKKQQCPVCHNFYSNLSTHRATHMSAAERPHGCTVCPVRFGRHHDLVRHMKKHTVSEGPYACTLCGSRFFRPPELTRHMKTHTVSEICATEKDEASRSVEEITKMFSIRGTYKCPYHYGILSLFHEYLKAKKLRYTKVHVHRYGFDHIEEIAAILENHHDKLEEKEDSEGSSEKKITRHSKMKHREFCHHTGIFTRRDTFKKHMKSFHFNYPEEVQHVSERQNSSGTCKKCGKKYENSEIWLNEHILENRCGFGKYYEMDRPLAEDHPLPPRTSSLKER